MLDLVDAETIQKRIEEAKYDIHDIILGDLKIKMEPTEEEGALDFSAEGYTLTKNAENHILKQLGIPPNFWRKQPSGIKSELWEYWEKAVDIKNTPIVMKTREKGIYALLEEDKVGITNEEIFDILKESSLYNRFDLFQLGLHDFTFDLRAVMGTIENDQKLKVGDLYPGVHFTSSETGNRKTMVLPIIYRVSCSNGLIMPYKTLDDGFKLPSFTNYSSFSRQVLEGALIPRCAKYAMEKRKRFDFSKDVKVKDPEALVHRYCREFSLNKPVEEAVQRCLHSVNSKEYVDTAFGVCNAFTRAAQDMETPDRQIKVEKIGWRVLDRLVGYRKPNGN